MMGLREITIDDAETIFRWRNDPYIFNLGSLQKKVTWEEHLNWIRDTLKGIKRQAFILEINQAPVGQIRFDVHSDNSCFISVYLIQEFSGKGYGVEFIKLGCNTIFSKWEKLKIVYALVRRDNEIGHKAFVKAGFANDITIQDKEHFGYSLTKS